MLFAAKGADFEGVMGVMAPSKRLINNKVIGDSMIQ